MYDPQSENPLAQQVKVLQIIILAMVMGVVMFAGIAMAMQREPSGDSLLSYTAAGMALFGIVARVVVPAAIVGKLRQQLAEETGLSAEAATARLATMYQTRTIVAAALVEGPALIALVAYLMEGKLMALGCAAVMLATLATLFPTANSARSWLEGQTAQLVNDKTW